MNRQRTGYPSIDKPWEQYYSEDEKNLQIPEGTMFDYIFEKNSSCLSDIAIEFYGHHFTYRELFSQIDKCCRNLSGMGVKKGDIVTIQAIPLPQVVIIIYALTRIGACGNMLFPDAKAEDVISMRKTKSKLLIVVDKLLSTYEEELPATFDHSIILLNVADQMSWIPRLITMKKASYTQKNMKLKTIPWRSFIRGDGEAYKENHDGTIPAFMLRTGGTTGIPKEVVLNSRGFNAVAESIYYHGISDGYKRQDTTILFLPPFIAFGIGTGIHHPIAFGAKLVISLDISPAAVSGLVAKNKPRYISAGVVQMEQFVNDMEKKKIDLSFLKLLWVGGEAMNRTFEDRLTTFLQSHGSPAIPLNGYGLTETTAGVTAETMAVHRSGSAGTPFAFCSMKVIDTETGNELPYNSLGEICLSSPGVMQEYYLDQEATNEVVESDGKVRWLHTGDIGYISEDGLLTITGRLKRIIVCKEGIVYHKVFPLVIEGKLAKVPGVREITIVGKSDEDAANILVAFVTTDDDGDFEQMRIALQKYCLENLQSFESPKKYIHIENLPRTLIGKVDYRLLEKMAKDI